MANIIAPMETHIKLQHSCSGCLVEHYRTLACFVLVMRNLNIRERVWWCGQLKYMSGVGGRGLGGEKLDDDGGRKQAREAFKI